MCFFGLDSHIFFFLVKGVLWVIDLFKYFGCTVLSLFVMSFWELMLMCVNEGIWPRFGLFRTILYFLLFGYLVHLLVFLITDATITSGWLCITAVVCFVGILFDLGMKFGVDFFLKGEECIDDLSPHLMIVWYLVFVYSVVLNIAKKGTFNC